jgi:hypothetical protein
LVIKNITFARAILNMKQVTLHIPDTNFPFFMELAKSLQFVKKIEDTTTVSKKKVLQNVQTGLNEVALYKKGKLKTTAAKDFLNEL